MKNYQLFNERWVDVLTQNKEQQKKEFEKILKDSNNIIGRAILKYREELFQNGRGNINYNEIENAYMINDRNKLRKLLQELFLEYIDNDMLEIALKILEKKGKTLKDLYEIHKKKPYKRMIRLAKAM